MSNNNKTSETYSIYIMCTFKVGLNGHIYCGLFHVACLVLMLII